MGFFKELTSCGVQNSDPPPISTGSFFTPPLQTNYGQEHIEGLPKRKLKSAA
jgi:hypothetical protein